MIRLIAWLAGAWAAYRELLKTPSAPEELEEVDYEMSVF